MPAPAKVALAVAGALGGLFVVLVAIVALLGSDVEEDPTGGTVVPVTPTDEAAASPARVPTGFQTVRGDGVSIALPSAWVGIPLDELELGSDDLATRFGGDVPEEIAAMQVAAFQQGAVLVAADPVDAVYSNNINILRVPGPPTPLTLLEAQAEAQLAQLGVEVSRITRTELAIGEAVRVDYRGVLTDVIEDMPPIDIEGTQHYVNVGGSTYVLTIIQRAGGQLPVDVIVESFRIG